MVHRFGGGDLKYFHWSLFKKGMKIHIICHVKVRSPSTIYILLAKFGEVLMELYALKLTLVSNNGLPTYPPLD